ncbi:hypothetical protein HaLaN_21878, partial [Haematococcus lacustris]
MTQATPISSAMLPQPHLGPTPEDVGNPEWSDGSMPEHPDDDLPGLKLLVHQLRGLFAFRCPCVVFNPLRCCWRTLPSPKLSGLPLGSSQLQQL